MEEKVETAVKGRERKEHVVRPRGGGRGRGGDSLPKAILKRKKATNYWLYGGGAAAALVVILLMVVGYSYLS